jgi:phage shock protein C
MDDLISQQLSGHSSPFALARDAHAILQQYLRNARGDLGSNPDGDEILRDLESSIGDHLTALHPATGKPVTRDQIQAILAGLGTISSDSARPVVGAGATRGRFWCRITEGKWFGGICLGIAAYGTFRVDWVRTVILLLTILTGGILAVVYLILLLVLPVVSDVSEYEHRRDSPRSRN